MKETKTETIEEINETKSWFFEMIKKKIDKSLARLTTGKKREGSNK